MKEHRTACIKGEVEKSAIADHACSTSSNPVGGDQSDRSGKKTEGIHLVPEEERLNRALA